MKIQINNLEALERLIGGDTELEMEIRNSVVQDFSKKHLKIVAKEMLDKGMLSETERFIQNEFFLKDSWGRIKSFSPKYRELIEKQITDAIRREVDLAIRDILEYDTLKQTIRDRLELTVEYINTELKSSELERRLNEMVNKRLKDSLGLNKKIKHCN